MKRLSPDFLGVSSDFVIITKCGDYSAKSLQ